MKLARLFSNFFKSDIRKKLLKISKIVGFNIYPTNFCEKGFKSLYSNIILKFLLFGKSKNIKKFIYQEIINNTNQKKNVLISLPRSGSMATRLMLNTYFELMFKVGNGVPKYDSINHKWNFIIPNILSAELYNNLGIKNLSSNYNKYLDKENYDLHKIFFTRFPLSRIDVLKLEKSRPVLILREPSEQILSYYSNHYSENLEDFIIKEAYENYIKFTTYWYDYLKNLKHKENFLIIEFKDIQENPKKVLKDILNFYRIKFIESYADISSSIHTKQNTSERLKNIELKKTRFTDIEKKKKFQEDVKNKLCILNKNQLLEANYKKLINIKI